MAVSFLLLKKRIRLLAFEIMLGQCPLYESNNNTDCGSTFEKNTSFNQVFTWFDVNLPDLVVTKILCFE